MELNIALWATYIIDVTVDILLDKMFLMPERFDHFSTLVAMLFFLMQL